MTPNLFLLAAGAALCVQLVTSQYHACPTMKTTIIEHEDKISKLEIKVQQIHKTCTRRREIIEVTSDLVGRVRGLLLDLRSKLEDCKVALGGEQGDAFDKWLAVIDSLISEFTYMRPHSDLGATHVDTCITTVTEVTQRITKLRHKLKELVVIQACDRVSVQLREVVEEYQRIETVLRKFTEITATSTKLPPSRGRDGDTFNTAGGPAFVGNSAAVYNYGAITESQFELFGNNLVTT